jgi:hypothetical protein
MKQIKTLILGIAATAGVLVPLADANACRARGWGDAGRCSWGLHGGAYYRGGAAYHGGC